jgi:hypothetical protein
MSNYRDGMIPQLCFGFIYMLIDEGKRDLFVLGHTDKKTDSFLSCIGREKHIHFSPV